LLTVKLGGGRRRLDVITRWVHGILGTRGGSNMVKVKEKEGDNTGINDNGTTTLHRNIGES
jgi:hypothetical protein